MKDFEKLLDEYRGRGVHFVHLKTSAGRDLFFILDDSYYLTYRDDKKEIAISLPVKPKDDKHEEIWYYNTNKRSFDDWYADICEAYDQLDDAEFYSAPNYEDIHISYVNEEEKVPLKDFLAMIPKTTYKVFGDFVLFDEIGSGLDKIEKSYRVDEESLRMQIRNWLHFDEEFIKAFNYAVAEPVKSLAVRIDTIEEVVPAHTNVRFVFDNGSVQILKEILKGREKK